MQTEGYLEKDIASFMNSGNTLSTKNKSIKKPKYSTINDVVALKIADLNEFGATKEYPYSTMNATQVETLLTAFSKRSANIKTRMASPGRSQLLFAGGNNAK